jgi:hypothetical protein
MKSGFCVPAQWDVARLTIAERLVLWDRLRAADSVAAMARSLA